MAEAAFSREIRLDSKRAPKGEREGATYQNKRGSRDYLRVELRQQTLLARSFISSDHGKAEKIYKR